MKRNFTNRARHTRRQRPTLFTLRIGGNRWRAVLVNGWEVVDGKCEDLILDWTDKTLRISNRVDTVTLTELLGDAIVRLMEHHVACKHHA